MRRRWCHHYASQSRRLPAPRSSARTSKLPTASTPRPILKPHLHSAIAWAPRGSLVCGAPIAVGEDREAVRAATVLLPYRVRHAHESLYTELVERTASAAQGYLNSWIDIGPIMDGKSEPRARTEQTSLHGCTVASPMNIEVSDLFGSVAVPLKE